MRAAPPAGEAVLSGAGTLELRLFPGRLAQLGERRLDKAEVTGSSPVSPTEQQSQARGLHRLEVPTARQPSALQAAGRGTSVSLDVSGL